jgi:hypothetical protein
VTVSDTSRRNALLERSRLLRQKAAAFNERLQDPGAKGFMKTMVFHSLDDVDTFFLGDENSRPSSEAWEGMWLDSADSVLGSAEESFKKFEAQVNAYGGPENVKMIG